MQPLFAHRRLPAAIAICLVAGVFAVYSGVAEHGWHARDDAHYVRSVEWIRGGVTAEGIVRAFSAPHALNWQPVTWISHMLDAELLGPRPGRLHAVNVALHALNAALLFGALYALTGALGRSACVAALFAFHPLAVESVAWIAERKNLLSTGFGFGALWCWAGWARRRSRSAWLGSLALFALSLMSKPMLVTFPFVLLLFDVWPLGRLPVDRKPDAATLRPLGLEKLPFFVLAGVFCAVTLAVQQRAMWEPVSLAGRLGRAMVAYAGYVQHAVWPAGLVAHYPYLRELDVVAALGAALGILAVSGGALLVLRRWSFVAVGWFLFLGTLVPVIGVIQVGTQSMADRYMYLPIVGLGIVSVWGVDALFGGAGRVRVALLTALAILVLAASAHQTRRYLSYWRSDLVLFARAIRLTTDNHVALTITCSLLGKRGRLDDAVKACRKAVRIEPNMASARQELATWLLRTDAADEAIGHLTIAARLRPERPNVLFQLGDALERTGNRDEAIQVYTLQLERAPDHRGALRRLATLRIVHPDPGRRDAQQALALATRLCEITDYRNAGALDVLAAALAENGRFDEALSRARQAQDLARAAGHETLARSIASRAERYAAGRRKHDD